MNPHGGALLLPFNGRSPIVDPSAFIAPGAVLVGDVTIGREASVWFGTIIRGDEHPVVVGDRTNIQDLSMGHETSTVGPLTIGHDVTIGHRVILHGCTIGNWCMIGMGAIILDGARIGDECLIAAGAVVREGTVIPPRSLVTGLPAQVKRPLTADDLARIRHAAGHYVLRAKQYKAMLLE